MVNRRRFLQWTALLGVAAVLGWRFFARREDHALPPLRNLSKAQTQTLVSLIGVMTLQTERSVVTELLERMDRFLDQLRESTRKELRLGLVVFEHAPLLFNRTLKRFSQASLDTQEKIVQSWSHGSWWKRAFYRGVKELVYLVHYTKPANWTSIHYSGPLVESNSGTAPFDGRYLELRASPDQKPKGWSS